MARFVYHSRIPGNTITLIGFGACVAFLVLSGLLRISGNRSVAILVFFGLITVIAVVGPRLFQALDERTRRVQKVVPLGLVAKTPAKASEVSAAKFAGGPPDTFEMEWSMGPTPRGLRARWIGTICCLGLAVLTAGLSLSGSLGSGAPWYSGKIWFSLLFAWLAIALWAAVVRFRIHDQIVTIERPYSVFNRSVSFHLSEIDEVHIRNYRPEATSGKTLTITLVDGRKIEYCESDEIIDRLVEQLRLAIEGSRQLVHPLSDEAIR